MKVLRLLALSATSVLFFQMQPVGAAILYSEFDPVQDLSGDRLNPTQLTLSPGTNSLIARSSGGANPDREYFTLNLPANLRLDHINLASYVSNDDVAFLGAQAGATFTEPPVGTNASNLLGWTHFGPSSVAPPGTDLLDNILAKPGQSVSLPSGKYTFWAQQTGESARYQLDFVVTSVPEPSLWALLMVGLLAIGVPLHRRRHTAT